MDKPELKLLQNEDIDTHTNQPQQVEMPFAIVEKFFISVFLFKYLHAGERQIVSYKQLHYLI